MSSNPSIPQFVVIKDHTAQSHRHPVVHYVFEDEELDGGVPKDGCIVVDLSDTCSEVVGADSYSPLFQVTECRVEAVASSTAALSTNMGGETTDMMMLTIEGISVEETRQHQGERVIPQSMDSLNRLVLDFKQRNDLLRKAILPSNDADVQDGS